MIRRRLANAPIVEALVDLRVDLSGMSVEDLDSAFSARVSARYPIKKQNQMVNVEIGEGGASKTQAVVRGHLYSSTDGLQIVQARLDGFTFSRLKPSTSGRRFVMRREASGTILLPYPSRRLSRAWLFAT
jgi:uncharacterized protein (TIGR04255 family)